MMDEMTVKNMIDENNKSIDAFVNTEIPKRLNANKNLSFGQWCSAVGILQAEIYPKSYALMKKLQSYGFDVKINMQSYKLVYCGRL
jgi:hypothetical protein